jgi:hypothetical protein
LEARLSHLTEGHHDHIVDDENKVVSSVIVVWSPLLQVLIMSRLNLSLVLLKPELSQHKQAADQALAALKLLLPFVFQKGKVVSTRNDKEHVLKDSEPDETYAEAKPLQAKSFFRLGCAERNSESTSRRFVALSKV